MKFIKLLTITTLFLATLTHADIVATITALSGKATIERNSQKIVATLGIKVHGNDNIITADNSKLQLIFKDETIISIGKNSHFSIKEYLFEENQEPVAKFGMLRGAMRTITGKIGKIAPQKFTVTTKTATIGIRGTNFSVITSPDGSLQAYCTYGKINVTFNNKEYIVKQGFFVDISNDGRVQTKPFSAKELKNMRKQNFGSNRQTKNSGTKEYTFLEQKGENTKQIDVDFHDGSSVVFKNITETNSDNILDAQNTLTLDGTIADYSMSNALYYGSYSTVSNTGSLPANGDTKLAIDFSNDSALLEIGSFAEPEPKTAYQFSNVNANSITGQQIDGNGVANNFFYGPTGNSVKGDFTYEENSKITANGVYSAETFQELR